MRGHPLKDCNTNRWVDADKRMPERYDLVEFHDGDKLYSGWWNGLAWDGKNVPSRVKPLQWRRLYVYH